MPDQSACGDRAVLIDLDGTLVDTAEDIVVSANRMLDELGVLPLPFATIKGFIGKGVPNLVRRTLETAGVDGGADAARVAEAEAIFHRHYIAVNGRMGQMFAGVEAGLDALCRLGYRLACVTNKPEALAAPLLAITGLDTWFEALVAGDSIPQMKPHPEPLLHACRLLGVAPQRSVLVGDSPVDVAAARAAGIPVAIVKYGYAGPAGPEALGGDWLIDSFEDLPELLARDRFQPAA